MFDTVQNGGLGYVMLQSKVQSHELQAPPANVSAVRGRQG
jgi:hypothetical protein